MDKAGEDGWVDGATCHNETLNIEEYSTGTILHLASHCHCVLSQHTHPSLVHLPYLPTFTSLSITQKEYLDLGPTFYHCADHERVSYTFLQVM